MLGLFPRVIVIQARIGVLRLLLRQPGIQLFVAHIPSLFALSPLRYLVLIGLAAIRLAICRILSKLHICMAFVCDVRVQVDGMLGVELADCWVLVLTDCCFRV